MPTKPGPGATNSGATTADHGGADRRLLALPADARVLFASDMHVGEHDPATADWFCTELSQQLRGALPATHLILLGDLFEAWVGDDQTDSRARRLVDLLAAITRTTPVFVMRGNRDFLLDQPLPAHSADEPFSRQTGATMLADPCVLTLGTQRWVLTHGDILCTDDTAYQDFRSKSRTPEWQREFLNQPLAQRLALATQMRAQSELEKANKAANLTDVNQQAVQACLTIHDAPGMIHGHTHRPNTHHWRIGGLEYVRHVLPDWERTTGAGGFGWLSADGFEVNRPSG